MTLSASPPYICLITEGKATPENFETEKTRIVRVAIAAVEDGVGLIQIREKSLSARELYDLTREIKTQLSGSSAVVLLNDRPDIAAAAHADGVHLPESSLPPAVVRRWFPDLVIGVSTHSFAAAESAASSGADYIFFGPVFESPGKGDPVGTSALRKVCRRLGDFPVIALGGIDPSNASRAAASGAAGIAAIRSLNDRDPRREICRTIDTEYERRSLE